MAAGRNPASAAKRQREHQQKMARQEAFDRYLTRRAEKRAVKETGPRTDSDTDTKTEPRRPEEAGQ